MLTTFIIILINIKTLTHSPVELSWFRNPCDLQYCDIMKKWVCLVSPVKQCGEELLLVCQVEMKQIKFSKKTERQRLSFLDEQAEIIPTLRRQKTNPSYWNKTCRTCTHTKVKPNQISWTKMRLYNFNSYIYVYQRMENDSMKFPDDAESTPSPVGFCRHMYSTCGSLWRAACLYISDAPETSLLPETCPPYNRSPILISAERKTNIYHHMIKHWSFHCRGREKTLKPQMPFSSPQITFNVTQNIYCFRDHENKIWVLS